MSDPSARNPGRGRGERRRFTRSVVRLCVSYKALEAFAVSNATSQDVGAGGLRLHVDAPLVPGTQLRIVVAWPGWEMPLRFVGEVVWCSPCLDPARHGQPMEAGIRFVQIRSEDRMTLIRFVERGGPESGSVTPRPGE